MKEPLKELFDLYEAEMQMPPMEQPEGAPPSSEDNMHPVAKENKALKDALNSGMGGVEAHENVFGKVNVGDVESKSKLASSLGTAESQRVHAGALPEPGSDSLFAQEFKDSSSLDHVTDQDLRSPVRQQIPDAEQQAVETQEEIDYNDDVAYLRKYGRA